jgi:hypothetical protein
MLHAAWARAELAFCQLVPAGQLLLLLLLLLALVAREMLPVMALLLLCQRCPLAYADQRCRLFCWQMLPWQRCWLQDRAEVVQAGSRQLTAA